MFLLFYFRPDSYPYKTMHKVIHRYYCRTIDRINESFGEMRENSGFQACLWHPLPII